MYPVSFKAINRMVRSPKNPIPDDEEDDELFDILRF